MSCGLALALGIAALQSGSAVARDDGNRTASLREISGRVATSDGFPYSNVAILAQSLDGSLSVQESTDGNGNFSMLAPRGGGMRLWVTSSNRNATASDSIFCNADRTATHVDILPAEDRADVRVGRAHWLEVSVTDSLGRPAANAGVVPQSMGLSMHPAVPMAWMDASYMTFAGSFGPCYSTMASPSDGPGDGQLLAGYLPGHMGGPTNSKGRATLGRPSPFPTQGALGRVFALIRPGVTQQVPISAEEFRGEDSTRLRLEIQLPYLPLTQAENAVQPGARSGLPDVRTPRVLVSEPSGEPIKGVYLQILKVMGGDTDTDERVEPTAYAAYTNGDGQAEFVNLPDGRYRVMPGSVTAHPLDFHVAGNQPLEEKPPTGKPSQPTTRPSAPVGLRAIPKRTQVRVRWSAPVTKNATAYQVRISKAGKPRKYQRWSTTQARTVTLRKLARKKRFTAQVRASNRVGVSPREIVVFSTK